VFVAGLTGGIASGKSTVSGMFRQAGAIVIDADLIARQIVAPQMPAWKAIVSAFGETVLLPDGRIDRARLGTIVFNDARRRGHLEKIIHPGVRAEIASRRKWLGRSAPRSVVIQDIPLLFETGMTEGMAEILLVYVPRHVQLERLIKRDNLSKADARLRIAAQMPLEEKRRKATIIIDNQGTMDATQKQVARLYDRFVAKAMTMPPDQLAEP
jgi:dephospho-CoA kinase